MFMGPKNSLIYDESKGPPDYRRFRVCYDVWATALIMIDAVIPPWNIALGNKMRGCDELYGDECWPLLYQQFDRFLHEHLPRMLRREDEKLNKAILANASGYPATDFNPATPWGHIMFVATTDAPEGAGEHRWWAVNFSSSSCRTR